MLCLNCFRLNKLLLIYFCLGINDCFRDTYSHRVYHYEVNHGAGRSAAYNHCKEKGAYLLTVSNHEELEYFNEHVFSELSERYWRIDVKYDHDNNTYQWNMGE